jgi:hypothetical protein
VSGRRMNGSTRRRSRFTAATARHQLRQDPLALSPNAANIPKKRAANERTCNPYHRYHPNQVLRGTTHAALPDPKQRAF